MNQTQSFPIISHHLVCLLLLQLKHPSRTTYYYFLKKKNHLLLFFPQTTKLGRHGFFAARPSPLSVHAKKPIYHRIQKEQT